MALEVQDVRNVIDDALQTRVAECIINGDSPDDPFSELAKIQTVRHIVARITDQAIDDAMVELFIEASKLFDRDR